MRMIQRRKLFHLPVAAKGVSGNRGVVEVFSGSDWSRAESDFSGRFRKINETALRALQHAQAQLGLQCDTRGDPMAQMVWRWSCQS